MQVPQQCHWIKSIAGHDIENEILKGEAHF